MMVRGIFERVWHRLLELVDSDINYEECEFLVMCGSCRELFDGRSMHRCDRCRECGAWRVGT